MRLSTPGSVVAALLCALAAGCTATTTGNGASAQQDAGASTGGGAGTINALSCAGIIDCGSKCADTDTACSDACVAKGSPEAKDAVDKVVACVNANACADAQCFQTNCPAELEACIAAGSSGGEALSGTAPTGSVPGDLVGKWHSYDDFYEFRADGTVSRVTESKVGSCKSTRLENGTAVTSGTTLTLYFTSSAVEICNKPGSSEYTPNSQAFTYSVAPSNVGTKLVLTEQKCRYSDPAAAAQYCTTGYDKE